MIGMAAQGATRIAQQAENRAAESDKYYREVLAPRYLSQMDNQIAQGKELQDFSMGLARKNQGRLEDTTWKFQDQFYDDVEAYDDEATREQLAGAASADIQRSIDAGTGQMRRGLGLRGVNPNSGMSMMMAFWDRNARWPSMWPVRVTPARSCSARASARSRRWWTPT
jgi:hypothetical protein